MLFKIKWFKIEYNQSSTQNEIKYNIMILGFGYDCTNSTQMYMGSTQKEMIMKIIITY
jgi:hypothetical protein